MNIMGISIADKILTGTHTLGAIGLIVAPTAWLSIGFDIFMLELWCDADWTLADATTGAEVTIAADRVVTLAIRINKAKSASAGTLPVRVAGSGTLQMLAHAIDHAYADQV